jgi:alpha-beta hydrolase superfamily lysophospholipase
MGASIATRAAVDDPRIAALVLEAPYLDLVATLAVVMRRKRVPFPQLLARLITRRARRLAGGVSLTRPRPIDLAPRISAPVLVVHGSEDPLIPLPDALRLANAFRPPATLLEVPGAGHNSVVDLGGAALLDEVASFLDRAVAAPVPVSQNR